jgi:hypothetical protein
MLTIKRYIKRKAEQEAKALEVKAEKTAKQKAKAEDDDLVFGAPLQKEDAGSARPLNGPLSPKKTVKTEDPFA